MMAQPPLPNIARSTPGHATPVGPSLRRSGPVWLASGVLGILLASGLATPLRAEEPSPDKLPQGKPASKSSASGPSTPGLSTLSQSEESAKWQALVDRELTRGPLPSVSVAVITPATGVGQTPRDFHIWTYATGVAEYDHAPGVPAASNQAGQAAGQAGQAAATVTNRPATPQTVYGIGSVSKVFTATVMMALRDRGRVRLEEAVATVLPQAVRPHVGVAETNTGANVTPAMTYRHLASHTSGLSRLPGNLPGAAIAGLSGDPYGNYSVESLYEHLRTAPPPAVGRAYGYSNLGYGLLGHVLERAGGADYATLLTNEVTQPLGMTSTVVELPDAWRDRYSVGYTSNAPIAKTKSQAQTSAKPVFRPAWKAKPDWRLGCLAPAGAIRSTAPDLAKFVVWHLRAESAAADIPADGDRPRTAAEVTAVWPTTLKPASLVEMRHPIATVNPNGVSVGLGWHILTGHPLGEVVLHDGMTGTHAAFVAFVPSRGVGVVVLTNTPANVGELAMRLLTAAAGL